MEPSALLPLFVNLGVPGFFAAAFAEKFIPIVPSYIMLMLFGMSVADDIALLSAILATGAGSLAASLCWYGIGRGLGEDRVERAVARYGKYVLFRPPAYAKLADAYRRNRFWVTLVGQTVPVARIYLALPAGVLRLRPASFATAAGAGILVWNTPFLVLGHALRETGADPLELGFRVSIALVTAEIGLVAGAKLLHRRRRASLDAAARAVSQEAR